MKDQLKNSVSKKYVFALTLACVIIFGVLTALAWTTPKQIVVKEVVRTEKREGLFMHEAHLINNTIYGENLVGDYYPSSLVKEINLTYHYDSANHKGNYEITGFVEYKTKVKNKEVVLWKDQFLKRVGKFNDGKFEEIYTLDLSNLNEKISVTSKELGVRRLETAIIFNAFVNDGKTFNHTIRMIESPSGLIYFENVKKVDRKLVYSDKIVKNSINFMGNKIDVGFARLAFSIPLSVLIPLSAYSTALQIKNRKPKLKGIEKYVVNCNKLRVNADMIVILESKDDLKKVLEMIDKPIIKKRNGEFDQYVILDEKTAYIYYNKQQ